MRFAWTHRGAIRRLEWSVMLACVAAPPPAAARQDTVPMLPDIVVTANGRPVARELLTSRVTVIRGEELRARGVGLVLDAIRGTPGMTVVQAGGYGATASLFARGGESDYVRVLIDGVPVNEPGGAFDFAHLTTDNVERIEILRGPGSVIHGSDAVAGVVQIFTRQGATAPGVVIAGEGGTYGAARLVARASGGTDAAGYSVSLSRFRADGLYDINSNYGNTAASGLFSVRPDARTDVSVTFRYTDAEYRFPTDGAGAVADANQLTANEHTTLGIEAGRFVTDRIEARVQIALNDLGTLYDDRQDGPDDTVGFFAFRSQRELRTRSAGGRVNVYVTPAVVLTGGAAIAQQWQRTDADLTRVNRAYYAEGVAEIVPGLAVNGGLRVDDNERFGAFVTYRAGVGYRLPSGTRVHVGAASGFKEPTFLETYDAAFSLGNPDLAPERSRSWEFGLEQTVWDGRAVLSGTYYLQRFSDLVQYTFAPPDPADPNYFNVAAAAADGLEVEWRVAPVSAFTLRGSYSYLRTSVTDAGFDSGRDAAFVTGDRLLRRPTHTLAGLASARLLARATFGAEVRYVGRRDDRDFAPFPAVRVELPAYTVLDLTATADLLPQRGSVPGLTLTARVENVFGTDYQEAVNFPSRGRVVMVGGRVGR